MTRCFYFGVWGKGASGHYLHAPGGSKLSRDAERQHIPFAMHILDSHLIPPMIPEIEGVVFRSVINGCTVLSFWDRSGDSRGKSNSAFVLADSLESAEAVRLARIAFPEVFARFTFKLQSPEGMEL